MLYIILLPSYIYIYRLTECLCMACLYFFNYYYYHYKSRQDESMRGSACMHLHANTLSMITH